jgi:hypothetical protein
MAGEGTIGEGSEVASGQRTRKYGRGRWGKMMNWIER